VSQYCADLDWAPDWISDFKAWGKGWECAYCREVHEEDSKYPIFIFSVTEGTSLVSFLKVLDEHVENVHYGPDAYEGELS
jgi:hypothetical protein